jgi:putative sterol carrier protein
MAKQGMNLRQKIEGMTLFFDPEASGELEAVIQYDFSGEEPGKYCVCISNGESTFHIGEEIDPTLTIEAPSHVWEGIIAGELDGADAMARGLYRAEGDISLLLRMGELFKPGSGDALKAPRTQKYPGPLRLSGVLWMQLAFLPLYVFWFLFDAGSISRWISVGVPLLLSLLTLAYRLRYGLPTWMEVCNAVFFSLAGLAVLLDYGTFINWGVEMSQAVLGVVWLATIFQASPLTAEYVKWGYIKPMWRNSLFIHPNAVLTLMWGWIYLFMAALGIIVKTSESSGTVLTIIRYGILVVATIVTIRYPRKADERRYVWERSRFRLRFFAGLGLAAAVTELVLLLAEVFTPV